MAGRGGAGLPVTSLPGNSAIVPAEAEVQKRIRATRKFCKESGDERQNFGIKSKRAKILSVRLKTLIIVFLSHQDNFNSFGAVPIFSIYKFLCLFI